MKVLHYKTYYLNLSETFINRLVRNHKEFEPVIATAYKKHYTEGLNMYEMPRRGLNGIVNRSQLMFNQSPSFIDRVIRKEKPAIIHGHFALDSYRLLRTSTRQNIPLIVNFYGYDVFRLPGEFGWKYRYQKLKKKADYFIAGSKDMKANLITLGFPENRIEIIKLGLDMSSIRYVHRTRAGMNLMIIGRMVEKKGFEYAIKAISILKKEGYQVHLDIYGDGPLHLSLVDLCRNCQVEEEVNFHGVTENEEITRQLYKHDILLSPSVQAKDGDREGIPQTIVEGMTSGIPVIASSHAGIPELILPEKTGMLIQERNAEAIAKSVIKLNKNTHLVSHISKSAREKVEQDHSIHKMVHETESLYKKVIYDR